MPTTIKDIAKKAKVSANTVSKALSNRSGVNKETRHKILKIAKELSYLPNVLARNLRLSQTKTIGVIISDNSNPFFAYVVKGIQDVARETGYHIILCNTGENPDFEQEAIDLLLELRVAGLLITPTQKEIDYIVKLKRLHVPFVLLARHFEKTTAHYVITDNVTGAYLATQHLIARGHQRVVFVNGPYQNSSARERLVGYKKALAENKIAYDKSLVEWGNLNMEDGYDVMKRVLAHRQPPLGVFLFSDYVAIGALKAVREGNLKVPQEVSIVGYDDIDFVSYLDVPLTTVHQPKYSIGKKAMEILIQIIDGKLSNQEQPQCILLEPELIIRKSG